jgi:hypothetical protein
MAQRKIVKLKVTAFRNKEPSQRQYWEMSRSLLNYVGSTLPE